MSFSKFNFNKEILKSLEEQQYLEPSPIQELAIPVILDGKDVLGCAQTGTGKTCAFVTPIIQKIINQPSSNYIKCLILAPTRELAIQIYENIKTYGKYTKIKVAVIYGGVKEGNQKISLRNGIDILVATPGRLLDFLNQKVVNISNINFFVLDEADRMLDLGFIVDIKKIIKIIPQKRQTLLFSATMPKSIQELCEQLLYNPIKISITPPSTTVETVEQSVYYVDKNNKINLLISMLKYDNIFSALIFCRSKHGADRINKFLIKAGILSNVIHGDKSQNSRQKALLEFKTNKIQTLVATDIAARGIDIDYLSHVFNYDLPDTSENYVHRIGRTARAGRNGKAITFCCIDEIDLLKQIEKDCKIQIKEINNHDYEMKIFTKTLHKTTTRQQSNKQMNKSNTSKDKKDIKLKNKTNFIKKNTTDKKYNKL